MDEMRPPEDTVKTPAPFYVNALWFFCMLWTVILYAMNVREFLTGGRFTYQGPGSLIYFSVLAAYAGVKEAKQWAAGDDAEDSRSRRGMLFVSAWLLLAAVAVIGINWDPTLAYPHELTTITLEVLGIFFGTQASRVLRKRHRESTARNSDLVDRILILVKGKGVASSGDLVSALGTSRATVQRALGRMVKEGLLEKLAESASDPDTRYKVT